MATPDELLRLLLDQNRDHAIILLDPAGTVVGWLPGAEAVFGYAAAEMVGRPLSTIFTPEDRERGAHEHELGVARADGRAEDDRWQVRRDGTRIWAGGVLVPLRDPAGAVVGFGKVLRDRTDVKAQVDALANAAERHKLCLGTLAHELRNPLAPLANAVELIRQTPGTDNVAGPLGRIERQVGVIRRLVDGMMEATRAGAGKLKLHLRAVHLEDVLTGAADCCRPQAEQRRQDFKVLLLPGPTVVEADPDRLHQVAVNLLANAIKYTPEGGGVWLKATVEGGDAVFRVEDNGCGIAPGMLPRIFDLFTQEAESADQSQGGLGLGLSVVKELVSLHGGTVQVRSEGRGKGSEFTVRLPLCRA
ncbi:sensor histidine kinase [Gemmata sp.]|uniref:sensor histidine kinase n=1 Tax=Gemmata sp. TaxID=1914242 RepID=UPI003F6F4634